MSRIYIIYGLRLLLHPVTLKAILVGLLFWRSTSYVSYAQVLANAPTLMDIRHGFTFTHVAMMRTETATIAILTIVGLLAIWMTRDILVHKQSLI